MAHRAPVIADFTLWRVTLYKYGFNKIINKIKESIHCVLISEASGADIAGNFRKYAAVTKLVLSSLFLLIP